MATSDRVVRYLGSTKNLVGCVAGLGGVGLHLIGFAGAFWLPVIAGLYLVGALAAPPERIHLAVDPTQAATQLRDDLDALMTKVRAESKRMPDGALDRLARVDRALAAVLARPDALAADPETSHGVTRLVRVDVPLAVETYLNLPWWISVAKRSAASELLAQLELLEADAEKVAAHFFAEDLRRQSDHTRYLRDRAED
ncbi:hypothetical protein [Actinokineospora diospyrosa]|uniref:Phage shock protein C (PspC) family protein n=1 Tax=Actinokineospora diospyrosa TaxID=103728 RepID=A0ABT1IH21_9PSEU|nr:hypothetical protein [Actinokineospora diospyrosa]MCP2271942.1 hypothetical protein [Actinokineospora diospyrosa]